MILLAGLLLLVTIATLIYVVPVVNRAFSVVWTDPRERQRREVLQRLKELHVDGHVPEETATLMAASEFNTTEADLLKTAELFSPSDMGALLTGKRNPFNAAAAKMMAHMRKSSKVKPAKRRTTKPQVDEVDGSVEDTIQEDGSL